MRERERGRGGDEGGDREDRGWGGQVGGGGDLGCTRVMVSVRRGGGNEGGDSGWRGRESVEFAKKGY